MTAAVKKWHKSDFGCYVNHKRALVMPIHPHPHDSRTAREESVSVQRDGVINSISAKP